jgi:mannose-6-phosphate isomerase-like protein (cupin superfamily)
MTTEAITESTTAPTQHPKLFRFYSEDIKNAVGIEEGQRGMEFELPGTDALSARVKVYVEGGENEMHSHPREDHTFCVLEGEATFRIERDDNTVVARQHDAVLLPRGTRYWFTNTGGTNLVMLRIGSGVGARYRLDAAGNEMTSSGVTWNVTEGERLD